ncbi:integrator complex subunit 5 isoform X2 [Periplaneta americana]|uniref:integrator complex subunit 5 isoform X2 n=1 Tax=Periplaneta americana TaxID=6978 RepID=UPI0037E73AB2
MWRERREKMSGTSVIKTVPPQDLMSDLRTFVAGATRPVKTNPLELARTALSILKTLPAARDAVLEYFCTLFDSAVSKYVTQIETDICLNSGSPSSGHEDATIVEIHVVLCSFVSSNPKAWAPIISTWSLELLGELSSRYAGRAHVPLTAGLNETLQLWMSCRATRTLIDITTQCLSCLMHSDTEACINALLDTSVAHSPHFDWVVAHVGSCFPHTVITRVLSCGLKDFSQHGSADQSAKAPKLNSVVGILGHLAGSHFVDIRSALLELFEWSLEPELHEADGDNAERPATVPFLLQLASLSPTLLRALTSDVLQTLTPSMLPKLAALAPNWCNYFGGSQALEDLIVHLALGCEQGGTQILKLLLDASSPLDNSIPNSSSSTSVKAISREILELLLQEIDHLLRSTTPGSCTIPLLGSIKQEMSVIQPLLLSSDPLRVQTAVRLLGLLGYHSTAVLVSSAAFLLQRATTDDHLAALVRLVTGGVCNSTPALQSEQDNGCFHKYGCLAQALEQAVRSNTGCILVDEITHPAPEQLWHNIARLLRWEHSGKAPFIRGSLISRSVRCNLREASELLCKVSKTNLAHAIAAALDLAIVTIQSPNDTVSVQLTLQLAKAAVAYFFLCMGEKDHLVRLQGVHLCCRLLARLASRSPPARSLALRELLEGSLFHSHSHLFGAKFPSQVRAPKEDIKLLHENHKQGTSVMLAQRHSSVFHAGVIGHGPRKTLPNKSLQPDSVTHSTQLLIEVIKACCSASGIGPESGSEQPPVHPVSLDAITTVSLLLVELISPDVMYNGLPWPEEEFCKVTVERDLHIRRLFDDLPLTWHLMALVASYRPALCYCSVLLRALTATLLAQWGSAAQQVQHNDKLLATTTQVLELMALGQLLPPPLSSLRDVIPHLKPQEVVQLLRDCVWNYLRDHVPSPALFTRDENGLMWRDATLARPGPQYTDTLRSTMQNNIQCLGTLYSQLFPPTPPE